MLTWGQKVSDLVVALGERVEEPAAAREVAPVHGVIVVGQGAEAVDPQPHPLDLSPVDPRVALDPIRGAEGQGDEDGHDGEGGQGPLAGQRALPIDVRVGEDIVLLLVHHFYLLSLFICPKKSRKNHVRKSKAGNTFLGSYCCVCLSVCFTGYTNQSVCLSM